MYITRFMRTTLALGTLLGLILVAGAAFAGPPTYTATDLGALGTGVSTANAVNSSGEVVGYSETNSGLDDGFSWQSGAMTDLGTLAPGQFSFAYGINDSGLIVGTASDSSGNYHAILWRNGQMTDLGFLSGGNQASAMAINNSGVVAGYAYDSNNNSHAVIWQPGSGGYSITDLGTFSGTQSAAYAINAGGEVTGYYIDSDGNAHGFVWQNGIETNLGDLGGGQSYGQAINSSSLVVGQSLTAGGDWHAFSWQNGVMTDLGALDGVMSSAYGVGDTGVIVGQSSSPDGTDHAVLWQGGQIVDLGSYVGQNSDASAINNSGQIVGQGNLGSSSHAFLLTPVASSGVPPVTTASLAGPTKNTSGWYTGPVTVTLTAADSGGPGVADTYYTIDGGSQQTYSGAFTISSDGIHTLSYWSVDSAGDTETAHSQTVQIDSTPPVTTAILSGKQGNGGWYIGPVTVSLSAQDATSGVAKTFCKRNNDRPQVYTGPFTASFPGVYLVHFRSVDVAGNREQRESLTFKIDNHAPEIAACGCAKSQGSGNWLVTIVGSEAEWYSGLASTKPTMQLTDNEGSVSPIGLSVSVTSPCWLYSQFFDDFCIQFQVNDPSTVASNGKAASDKLNVSLSIPSSAGLTGSTTIHIAL